LALAVTPTSTGAGGDRAGPGHDRRRQRRARRRRCRRRPGIRRGGRARAAHRRLTSAGALGGGLVGAAVQWVTRGALSALVGLDVAVGGGLEGVAIGGAAGLAFAIATRRTEDGLVAPRVRSRWQAAVIMAVACGLAGLGSRPLDGRSSPARSRRSPTRRTARAPTSRPSAG
jgi:hypothetical protein